MTLSSHAAAACDHNLLDCSGHGVGAAWRGRTQHKELCEGVTTAAARTRNSALPPAPIARGAEQAAAMVDRAATRRDVGFCEQTWRFSDCESGSLGSWALPAQVWLDARRAKIECVQACLSCKRCSAVSVSVRRRECSWFRACNFSQLETLPQYPLAHARSFVSIEVRPFALQSR